MGTRSRCMAWLGIAFETDKLRGLVYITVVIESKYLETAKTMQFLRSRTKSQVAMAF